MSTDQYFTRDRLPERDEWVCVVYSRSISATTGETLHRYVALYGHMDFPWRYPRAEDEALVEATRSWKPPQ